MERKIALLIDADNVSSKYISSIINELDNKGDLIIKRIYGDWTTNILVPWKDILNVHAIRPVQQFRYGPNATDNSLIMDALDITYINRTVNTFCIVSSDIDYYGLYSRLREHGYYVIGMGKKNTNDLLIKSSNEFIYLENLMEQDSVDTTEEGAAAPAGPDDRRKTNRGDLLNIFQDIYDRCSKDEDDWVYLSQFGIILKKNYPDFDPRTYGQKNLYPLLEKFSKDFILKRDKNNPLIIYLKRK